MFLDQVLRFGSSFCLDEAGLMDVYVNSGRAHRLGFFPLLVSRLELGTEIVRFIDVVGLPIPIIPLCQHD